MIQWILFILSSWSSRNHSCHHHNVIHSVQFQSLEKPQDSILVFKVSWVINWRSAARWISGLLNKEADMILHHVGRFERISSSSVFLFFHFLLLLSVFLPLQWSFHQNFYRKGLLVSWWVFVILGLYKYFSVSINLLWFFKMSIETHQRGWLMLQLA